MNQDQASVRVAHIIGRLIPGGVEMRTLELIRASENTDIKHFVYVTSGLTGNLDDAYKKAGAEVIYGKIYSASFPYSFFKFLRSQKISVVHSNIMYPSGLILAVAKAARVRNRIVHFRSDGYPLAELPLFARLKRLLFAALINNTATKIVGLTPKGLELAWKKDWREDNRCTIITNGVTAEDFNLVEPPAKLKTIEREFIIAHVGKGDLATKNRGKAIRVLATLLSNYDIDVQLVFVGRDGLNHSQSMENRAQWEQLADSLGVSKHVTFAGQSSEVPAFLANSHLFMFTSTLEGLPGVVLEARASGLPIVSSDLPGVKFIAETFPDIELLSPTDSDENWSEAIMKIMPITQDERLERQRSFRGTRYEFQNAFLEYQKLWNS